MSEPKQKIPHVSHLFQVQLVETRLTPEQVKRMAATIREATTKELLKMDFRMEEISPIFAGGVQTLNCGNACRSCKETL